MENSQVPQAPDGGWGWMVLLGAFVAYFIADGWSYSFGVVFPELVEYFGESKGKTALIPSLVFGVPMIIAPVICAIVNNYGCRITAIVGGFLMALSLILSSFATSVAFLCLTTGVLASFGLAMAFLSSLISVTFYFERRRGLATGLAVTGAGLGSILLPPFIELLFKQYTWRGGFLIIGGICFHVIASGALYRPLPVPTLSRENHITAQRYGSYIKRKKGNIFLPRLHSRLEANKSQQAKEMSISAYDMLAVKGMGPKPKSTLSLSSLKYLKDKKSPDIQDESQEMPLAALNDGDTFVSSCPDLYTESQVGGAASIDATGGSSLPERTSCQKLGDEISLLVVSMFDRSLARSGSFLLFLASSFILFLFNGVPFLYLIDKALLLDIDEGHAVFLASIIGIGRTVGQILLGILGDFPKVNPILLYAVGIIISGIDTILLPVCVSYASLCAYAVVFGFFISVTYALQMICVVRIVGLGRATNAFGLAQLAMGIANLLGTPVAGWLYDVLGDYDLAFYIAGTWITASGLLLLPLPYMLRKAAKTDRNEESTSAACSA